MVSSLLADALSNPSGVLQSLYQKNREADNFPHVVFSHFASIFVSDAEFQQIPSLTVAKGCLESLLAENRPLVRFRAMVQSNGREVYCKELSNHRLGGWGFSEGKADQTEAEVDPYGDNGLLDDRTTIWAVSVPGEASWLSGTEGCSVEESSNRQHAQPMKYPFPSQPHLGVNVKLYGSEEDSLRLTDVVTFVGLLESATMLTSNEEEIEVPTLHVVFHRSPNESKLKFKFPMDLSIFSPSNDIVSGIQSISLNPISSLRSELIDWIATEGLGGDVTAAEWVLLACIARVQSREPLILSLSLTLSSFPPPPPVPNTSSTRIILEPTIKHVLQALLPALAYLPLSIPFLNESRFQPKSVDEDLHSGNLQLPAGTVVLVSDGAISEGNLHETGLRNVAALKQCIRNQTLDYIFPYSSFPFHTDLSFIILAQGRTSPFAETDVCVSFQPGVGSSALYKDATQVRRSSLDKLKQFRALLGGAKQGETQITEEVSNFIQEDFVQDRQVSTSAITPEDLVLRMSLTRLMALSFHSPEITKDIWELTKKLDQARKHHWEQPH